MEPPIDGSYRGMTREAEIPPVRDLNRPVIPRVLLVFEAALLLDPALVAVAPAAPDDEPQDAQYEAHHDDQDVRGVLQSSQYLAHAERVRLAFIGARASMPA